MQSITKVETDAFALHDRWRWRTGEGAPGRLSTFRLIDFASSRDSSYRAGGRCLPETSGSPWGFTWIRMDSLFGKRNHYTSALILSVRLDSPRAPGA